MMGRYERQKQCHEVIELGLDKIYRKLQACPSCPSPNGTRNDSICLDSIV